MSEEYRPSGFKVLPPVVKHLLIINAICYLAYFVLYSKRIIDLHLLFGDCCLQSGYFRPWQPFTYMFMHGSFDHLFFNMFSLWMFGAVLENVWGSKRFLIYYLACGLGVGLIVMFIPGFHIGASGAIYALLMAFAFLFPNNYVYLYFLVPIKTKWFIIGLIVVELFEGIFRSSDGIGHFGHLFGMVIGLVFLLIWKKKGKLYGDQVY